MIPAHDLIIDQFAPTVESGKRLTTWYAQGHSDGLGDRLLMFDNTTAPSWEILRFKPALASDPRFEAALRQRVDHLSSFRHPAFPLVRPIKKLGHEDGLAVVSTYASGASLAEALAKPRSPEFSVRLIRQLVPALVAFQQHAPGVAHGALGPDRIILTPDGRLMIREHMVGSAIESLDWPASRLWAEFNILTPALAEGTPRFDDRSDVAQLALVAVSLMAGRLIGPDEYPARVNDVLEHIARASVWQGHPMLQWLRKWLERALQLSDQPFASAREALDGLGDLRDDEAQADDPFEVPRLSAPTRSPVRNDPPPPMWSARGLPPPTDAVPRASGRVTSLWRRAPRTVQWAVVAIGVFAFVEAVIIGGLLYRGEAAPPVNVTTTAVAPVTSAPQVLTTSTPPLSPPLPTVMIADVAPQPPDITSATLPAPPVRRGGFRVSAPIDVDVLDGDRVVGSSGDGPIIAPVGRREFEFVNSTIGYRARQMVDVRPGQITSLSVTIPNGTLNINAVPWAAVWIDGTPYGETPLGNISIAPGEHEIVFRHPELGERRQRTLVRADTTTRVAVNLQR